MKQRAIILLVCLLVLNSCTKGFGNKLQSEKLEVFYPEKKNVGLADKLGKYWHENHLTSSKKQYIQIAENEKFFKLKIISTEKFDRAGFAIEEHQLLLELQKDINNKIFAFKPCHIVICDNEFKELFDINS